MKTDNRYFRGPGYHVTQCVAENFADKYIDDNGQIINMDSDDFKSDLEGFLKSHGMVEEAYLTIETEKLFNDLRKDEGVF